jgi:competence protein ComGC
MKFYRKKGFTSADLLVVLVVITLLLALLIPALSRVKKIVEQQKTGSTTIEEKQKTYSIVYIPQENPQIARIIALTLDIQNIDYSTMYGYGPCFYEAIDELSKKYEIVKFEESILYELYEASVTKEVYVRISPLE